MTVVTDELSTARTSLLETDEIQSVELVLKDSEVSVEETEGGPRASIAVDGEGVVLSELALKTLATTLGVPQSYLLKCPAHLQADNLIYWKGRLSDRKRSRVVIGKEQIQAITSPNFLPIRNTPIFDALIEKVAKGDESKIKLDSFEHDWNLTRIAVCHSDASHAVRNESWLTHHPDNEAGDIVRAGVNVQNSLTNQTKLELNPFAFRLICKNGMVTPIPGGDASFRFNPKDDSDPSDWLTAAIDEIGRNLEPLFANLDNIAERKLADPEMALNAQLGHVPGPMREAVLAAYAEEQTPTLWGVVNALTAAANAEELDGRFRRQVQSHAGHLALETKCEECGRPLDSNHS